MRLKQFGTGAALAIAIAGCGAAGGGSSGSTTSSGTATGAITGIQAHPQAVDPNGGSSTQPVGDASAHAPSLASVKHQLKQLDICGGATSVADSTPVVTATSPGFYADPGTIQNVGELPIITARLNQLATALGVRIFGISGYRSPAHSVAVGGYANDPHTRGEAEDIGVNSLLRSSAARITEGELARFGLYRPFDPGDDPNNTEVNHVQLIPAGGPLPLADAEAELQPDPLC